MKELEPNAAMVEWLKTRPESVQKLAAEFPSGLVFDVGGRRLHLIGWTEGDTLIVSEFDPVTEYEMATDNREYLCADHCRGAHREVLK